MASLQLLESLIDSVAESKEEAKEQPRAKPSENAQQRIERFKAQAKQYIEWEPFAAFAKQVNTALTSNDTATLESMFGNRIAFGAAGLRSAMRGGCAFMHDLIIIQTTLPTASGCTLEVTFVVTDNGLKVYFANSAQTIPPHDAAIASAILENLAPWHKNIDLIAAIDPLNANKHGELSQECARRVQQQLIRSQLTQSLGTKGNVLSPIAPLPALLSLKKPLQLSLNEHSLIVRALQFDDMRIGYGIIDILSKYIGRVPIQYVAFGLMEKCRVLIQWTVQRICYILSSII